METVEVKAHFDREGRIRPLSFTWQGSVHQVVSTGRRWESEAGKHMLVMTLESRVYELLFQPGPGIWLLKPIGRETHRV